MITEKIFLAQPKFLNKLTVHNCTNFLMTSNNEYWVNIDEGFSDRQYFILEGESSNANDEQFYIPLNFSYCSPKPYCLF